MNEVQIKFSLESPQEKNKKIQVSITNEINEMLFYKFIVGLEGVWTTLKDFTEETSVLWEPEKDGKYIIMVQAKVENSSRAFDYISRADYIIGSIEEKLIAFINISKNKITLGDKFKVSVETTKIPLMFKYWIKSKDGWELIRDYSPENTVNLTANEIGAQEILVEVKNLESQNNFDDFGTVKFNVNEFKQLEIINFKCLSNELLIEEELIFQVESKHEDSRMVLYKFIKIDNKGITRCIQDYSTKRLVGYVEKVPGEYKLLCLAKDMYSNKPFDDRAIIIYKVEPYRPIIIKSFTSDLSSPQVIGRTVALKAITEGGRRLLYRYKIEGNFGEDSGYIRSSTYNWKTKHSGSYRISVMVKDESYEDEYETISSIDYVVDEENYIPVRIKEIHLNKHKNYVKDEPIAVTVEAEGGLSLKYCFIVLKNRAEVERIEYGDCNWVNFTPEEAGEYDFEVRVKDKLSSKEYDVHSILHFKVKEYVPATIDYVLLNSKEYYMVGDDIGLEIVSINTQNTLIKYILHINGHLAEETEFIANKKYMFNPKCSGKYSLQLLAKSKDSKEDYDDKKELKVYVHDSLPVTNTKIKCDKASIIINEPVTFTINSEGGKDVCYEIYLMEQGEWRRVQAYSKKNYYSFIPFMKGYYKLLALSKSSYKKCEYEDYAIFEFDIEEKDIH